MVWNNEKLIKILTTGGVVVMPTDTIYGIVGRAEDENTVGRIYKIRKRIPEKPCIILIGDIDELRKFSIILSEKQKVVVNKYWPASPNPGGSLNPMQKISTPMSIVFDCPDESLAYLHRGTKTLAFRLPYPLSLRDLLLKTGPLIAPSANPEGLPPAQTIAEAKAYFEDSVDPVRGREGSQRSSTSNGVDLYLDGGLVMDKASRVIKLHKDGSISILRE